MDLLVGHTDLAAALSMVTRAAKTSSITPIVANVALQTRNDRLYMKCNNFEFGIETYITGSVIEQGEVTINATLLKNYIMRLPKETNSVHLQLNKTNLRLKIEVPGNEVEAVHINGIEISEFPQSPVSIMAHSIIMNASALKSSIGKVAYAAGTNEQYMTTTCVRFQLTNGESSLAASDGNRLAYYMFNPETPLPPDKQYELLVPAKALQEIASIIPNDASQMIQVGPNSNIGYIIFKWEQVFCYINLVEGTFPKLEKFIDFETITQMLVAKRDIEEKLADISVLTRSEADIVKIDVEHDSESADGLLKLFTSVEMVSDIHRQLVSNSVFGPNQSTMASIKLLREAIKSIDSPDIMLEFKQSPMPQIVFGPYTDEYKKHIAIVMPKFSN